MQKPVNESTAERPSFLTRWTKVINTMRCVAGHRWGFFHDAKPPVVICARCGQTEPMPYGDARMDYLAILRDQAVEIDKLRWLPERDPDRGEWADGWNRCLEYIMDKRAGIEPGDGEHE